MLTLDPKNLPALKFGLEIAPRLSRICEPLFKHFPISHFSYMQIFNNGTRLFLCPNSKWISHYIESNFQNDKVHPRHRPKKMGIHYGLWSSFEKDNIFSSLYDMNIWHGFTIFDRHPDYMNCYHFATQRKNTQISNFYLDNLKLLTHFIFYFKEQVSDILMKPDAKKMIISSQSLSYEFEQHPSLEEDKHVELFIQETQTKKYALEYNNHVVSFSKREMDCLLSLYKGDSFKLAARKFNISPRTVESYVNNMKNKLRCNRTDQLFEVISQNGLMAQIYQKLDSVQTIGGDGDDKKE